MKINRGGKKIKFIHLKGYWIRDPFKTILIDIDETETITFLFKKIGERMEETHEDFRGLRHCIAEYIISAKDILDYSIVNNYSSLSFSDVGSPQPIRKETTQLSALEMAKQKYFHTQNQVSLSGF